MPGRQTDVRVKVSGDNDLSGPLGDAERSAKIFERELAKIERQAQRTREEMAGYGKAVAAAGVAVAAGLALATRAAIEWESAFAGVRKTVDASEAQYARIAAGLRQLALETTASATQVAAVAEAAGQLDVGADQVVGFTRTMIRLGDTTNLSATEAATAIARLHNIMGVLNSEAGRTGSVIVELGNNFATTEQEITAMALRVAGAGRSVGLSTDEVLSLSAALSSLGVSAELGGTNVSKAITLINSAVRSGGKEMRAFADVAGVSADEFSRKWSTDPAAALQLFVEGLADVQASGGDTAAVLGDLGLTGSEMQRVMLSLAGGADVLGAALSAGNDEWDENTALLEEAAKRYGTTEARVKQAQAAINDAGISLGQAFAPAVGAAADRIALLASAFSGLPGPVQQLGGWLTAAAAAAAILGGGILVLLPRLTALSATLKTMGPRGAAAAGALSRVGTVLAGPWGVAMAGATLLLGAFIDQKARQKAAVDEARAAIEADSGAIEENTRAYAAEQLVQRDLVDVIDQLGLSHKDALDAALGNADAMARVRDRVEEIRSATGGENRSLALDIFGDRDDFRAATSLELGLEAVSAAIGEAQRQEEQFGLTSETAAEQTERLAGEMGELSGAAGDSEQAMTDLEASIEGLIDTVFGLTSAEDDFRASLLDIEESVLSVVDAEGALTKAREEHGASSREAREAEIGLERAQIDVSRALEDSTTSAAEYARELIKTEGFTDQTAASIEAMAQDLETQARAAGKSEDEARQLGDTIRRIPSEAETAFIMNGLETAVERVSDLRRVVNDVPGRRTIYFNTVVQGSMPASGFTRVGMAEGGILTANAGLMTRGVPGIAPANSSVLFAETPATGDEAYIPLGGAYRSRARQLHDEVGRRLGTRQGLSVSVQTDGTDAAEAIAAAVVTRTAEHAAIAHAWGAGL